MKQISRVSRVLTCALLGSALAQLGCGDDDKASVIPSNDAGTGNVDAMAGDAMAGLDASPPEAGAPDASRMDAAPPDSGTPAEAGMLDGTIIDTGVGADAGVGDAFAITSTGRVVQFQRATGNIVSAVAVTGLSSGDSIVGLDVRPSDGLLYALGSQGRLYTLNPGSGQATLKATLAADPADTSAPFAGLSGASFGFDFNPLIDALRVLSDVGQNLRVNPDTGATSTETTLTPTAPGIRAAAHSDSFVGTCRTQTFVLDGPGRKLLQQSGGRLTELVGLSGAATTELVGFDITTGQAGAQLGFVAGNAASVPQVADLDLSTGEVRSVRSLALASGELIRDVALTIPSAPPQQAAGELLATTEGNRVVSFYANAPTKLCTSAPITGLAAGETIVGADVRPADGLLWALGSTGKLYVITPSSGVATLRVTLTADAADTTEAYTALAGTQFGVAFNPVVDRLRVASDTGQNLRINPTTGATFTDAALSPASGVTAVAYTNGFAGTKRTTLFGINSGNDTLVRIGADPATGAACPDAGNPNCGIIAAIGPIGAGDISAINGFDIDAVTGTAVAAVSVGGSTLSTVFPIDLTTGAAIIPAGVTSGTVGGGERLRSLSYAATPALTAWAVTAGNRLVSFVPSSPGTLTSDVAITGLATGETLLGIDVRPRDGVLYAVSDGSRLYRLNATTGAATLVAALIPAENSSFTGLPTASYGMDFDPVADVVRLVNTSAQHLRILPSTRAAGPAGTTIIQATLSPGATTLAAAHTNNYDDSATSTLFVIDTTGSLHRLGGVGGSPSPNSGEITTIGTLGISASQGAHFDIVGGHNGLALAALSSDGTSFTLADVNLGTGAAAPYNATSNAVGTSTALRGLALTLR